MHYLILNSNTLPDGGVNPMFLLSVGVVVILTSIYVLLKS